MKKAMKFTAMSLVLLLGFITTLQAQPTEFITNGTFETGTFSGWTVINTGSGAFVINDGTFDPLGTGTPLAPITGSYDALTNQSGPSLQIVSQPFVVPMAVTSAILSWDDRIRNYAAIYSDPNQEFRVELVDGSGTVLATVYSTNPGDPLLQVGPNSRSFDLTSIMQTLSGQTVSVRFSEEDNLNYFNVTLDNISFEILSNYCPITNSFGPIWINSHYKAAGANDPQTYYWGLSYGVIVAKPTGGVAPYTYNWYSSAGYTIKNPTSRRPRLWYPTGPQWVYVDITDANNCTITDSIYINWVDYTCNQPLIWWYRLCDINTGLSTCVSTTVGMRNLVKTGNYVFCGSGMSMPNKTSFEDNINLDMGISVFPNPNNGEFTLIVSNAKSNNYDLQIFDMSGRLLHSEKVNAANDFSTQDFELSNLTKGIYLLHISDGKERAIERFVIQ